MFKVNFNGKKWVLITDEKRRFCSNCREVLTLPVFFCITGNCFYCEGCETKRGSFGDLKALDCKLRRMGNTEHQHVIIKEAKFIKTEKVVS